MFHDIETAKEAVMPELKKMYKAISDAENMANRVFMGSRLTHFFTDAKRAANAVTAVRPQLDRLDLFFDSTHYSRFHDSQLRNVLVYVSDSASYALRHFMKFRATLRATHIADRNEAMLEIDRDTAKAITRLRDINAIATSLQSGLATKHYSRSLESRLKAGLVS